MHHDTVNKTEAVKPSPAVVTAEIKTQGPKSRTLSFAKTERKKFIQSVFRSKL